MADGGDGGSTPSEVAGAAEEGSPFGEEGDTEIEIEMEDPSAYRLSPLPAHGQQLAPPPVRGLRNLGNSCYLNCVLQSVVATPGVREHFLFAPCGDAAAEGKLTATLRRLVLELHAQGRPERPIRPSEMLQAVANLHAQYARRGAEQDSHEVLRQMLEGIRSEEVARLRADGAAATPEPTTLIDDIYAGEIRSSIVCLGCGGVSCSTEPITDLSLPIPHSRRGTLEAPQEPPAPSGLAATTPCEGGDDAAAAEGGTAREMREMRERVLAKLPHELKAPPAQLGLAACLHSLCTLETLEGENAYSCDKCADAARAQAAAAGRPLPPSMGQPALKWLQVARTPRALTLHLKRFRWVGSKVHKVDAFVRFPLLLDLSPYACADAPVAHFTAWEDHGGAPSAEAAPAQVPLLMELYGVVQHEGSFEGGHYVAFVKLGDAWFRMNDSVVICVDEAQVLHAEAFMLFYRKL